MIKNSQVYLTVHKHFILNDSLLKTFYQPSFIVEYFFSVKRKKKSSMFLLIRENACFSADAQIKEMEKKFTITCRVCVVNFVCITESYTCILEANSFYLCLILVPMPNILMIQVK